MRKLAVTCLLGSVVVLIAAPALSQQRATPIAEWMTDADIPADWQRQRKEDYVTVAFVVSSEGSATQCRTVRSTGFGGLKKLVCELIEQRARYVPAHTVSGEPLATKDTLSVSFKQGILKVGGVDFGGAEPLTNPGAWASDLDLTATIRKKTPVDSSVAFRIGTDGRISGCHAAPPSSSTEADALTCALLRARAAFRPPIGGNGNPVAVDGSIVVRWRSPNY